MQQGFMNRVNMFLSVFGLWVASAVVEAHADGTTPDSPRWPLKVKLMRAYATAKAVKADGTELEYTPSFYVGRLSLGYGSLTQDMLVSFDTSSGNVVVPGTLCRSASCSAHRRYSARHSSTALDINTTGHPLGLSVGDREHVTVGLTSMELGDGRLVSLPVRETMCLWSGGAVSGRGTRACVELGMLVAADVTDNPFLAFPHDGIVGMGLHGLSINPIFNFVDQFFTQSGARDDVASQFGLFYGDSGGELALGGYDTSRLRASSPLQWVPVAMPEDGYWQVRIEDFRIGNQSLGRCKQGLCLGIVDTSASSMGVPSSIFGDVKETLAQGEPAAGLPGVAGRCAGPSFTFMLEGGVQLTLDPASYMTGAPKCAPQVSGLNLPESFGVDETHLFVLGEPFLRQFYSVYDWAEQRVGFGLAAEETAEDTLAKQEVDLRVAADILKENLHEETSAGDEFRAEHTFLSLFLVRLSAFALLFSSVRALSQPWSEIKAVILGNPAMAEALCLIEPVPANAAPDGEECAICLGSCEEAEVKDATCEGCSDCACKGAAPRWCRLKCGHQFHEDCIFQWLRKASQCPVCRGQVWPSGAKA